MSDQPDSIPQEVNHLRNLLDREMNHQSTIIEGWRQAYEHALRNVPWWKRSRVRREASRRMSKVFAEHASLTSQAKPAA